MCVAYICIHQGIGDLFNSIGLINFYSNKYNIIYIILNNNTNLNIMKEIYKNNNKIIPIIPEFITYEEINNNSTNNTCINCMTFGTKGYNCRNHKQCKYINYKVLNGDIIKIGSFNNYYNWEKFKIKNFSFAHAFYTYSGLNPNIRFTYFNLFNDKEKENNYYNEFIKKYGSDYILIHSDISRNLQINYKYITNISLPIIQLDNISDNFVELTKVIQKSKEIHLIDSSWSVYIYLLSNNMSNKIPIYLNETLSKKYGRDTNIYKNPTFKNWIFY